MSCLSRVSGTRCALPLALCVLGSFAPAHGADRSRERASELVRRRLALWKGAQPEKRQRREAGPRDFDLSTRAGQLRAYAQYRYPDEGARARRRRGPGRPPDDGQAERAAAAKLIRSACRRMPPVAFLGSWTLASVGAIDEAIAASPPLGGVGPCHWLLVGGLRGYFSATNAFDEPMWTAVKQVANPILGRMHYR